MTHCPDCEADLDTQDGVEFVEMDVETNLFVASKRYYLVACRECGAAIGGGVAGAK